MLPPCCKICKTLSRPLQPLCDCLLFIPRERTPLWDQGFSYEHFSLFHQSYLDLIIFCSEALKKLISHFAWSKIYEQMIICHQMHSSHLSLSLSLSHKHEHTHARAHTPTHTHMHAPSHFDSR